MKLANETHYLGNFIIVIPGTVFGNNFTCYPTSNSQIVGICYFIPGYQPGAENAKIIRPFITTSIREMLFSLFNFIWILFRGVEGLIMKEIAGPHLVSCNIIKDCITIDMIMGINCIHVTSKLANDKS